MMFERLPTVPRSQELLDRAFRRATRAGKSSGKEESMVLTAGNILSDNLANLVRKFPTFEGLPPFYRELVDVIVGVDEMRICLSHVGWASKQINKISREYVGKMRQSREKPMLRREAFGRMASIMRAIEADLLELDEVRNRLRKMPSVDPDQPTIIVAGYPNVGKSSFVIKVTGARPEIAAYPFTTQGIGLGHFTHNRQRYQVVDTPGLLDRPLAKRNEIERQAIAALQHLRGVVLYILDPSEHSGFQLDLQLSLLADIRTWLNLPVFVVANKDDLIDCTGLDIDASMSTLTGAGVFEVLSNLIDILVEAANARLPED